MVREMCQETTQILKKERTRIALVGQWLGLSASTAGLIPGQGTKILHALLHNQKKKKKKTTFFKKEGKGSLTPNLTHPELGLGLPFHPDHQCSFYEGWFEQVLCLSLNGMAWEDFKLTPQPCIHLSPIPQSIPHLCLRPSPLPPAAPPAFVLPVISFTADTGLSNMILPGPCFTSLSSSS